MRSVRQAITLVEVLIIALVLGVLAIVVVPQFSSADTDSRFTMLRTSLDDVRTQIRLYRQQHDETLPSASRFVEQMTRTSWRDGTTAQAGPGTGGLGPYLLEIPHNPYSGGNSVGSGPVGTSDWFYDEQTGEFRANHHPDYTCY